MEAESDGKEGDQNGASGVEFKGWGWSWAVYLLNTLYKLLPGCFQRNLGCFLE